MPRGRKQVAKSEPAPDGANRERMVAWFRKQVDRLAEDERQRVELAQSETIHPSPIYSRLVKHYAAAGFRPPLICQLLLMKPSVLRAFYMDELVTGPAQINLKMAETLMTIGFDPEHPQAANVAFKWLERMHPEDAFKPPSQRVEVKNEDSPRIIDSSTMTAEQREQVRQIILSAGETPPAEEPPTDAAAAPDGD
jgi:hypothetical protein